MVESGILAEDDRVELIDGEVRQMNPIGSLHAAIVNRLTALLTNRLGDRAIVSVQNPVILNDLTEPQPDIVILRARDDFYKKALPGPEDVMLVIEVADSTLEYDRDEKVPRYAQMRIPEVWLVDVNDQQVTFYAQPGGDRYQQVLAFARPGVGIGRNSILAAVNRRTVPHRPVIFDRASSFKTFVAGFASIRSHHLALILFPHLLGPLGVEAFPAAGGGEPGHDDLLVDGLLGPLPLGDFLLQGRHEAGLLVGRIKVRLAVAARQRSPDRVPLLDGPLAQGGLHRKERPALAGPLGFVPPELLLGPEGRRQPAGHGRQVPREAQAEPRSRRCRSTARPK